MKKHNKLLVIALTMTSATLYANELPEWVNNPSEAQSVGCAKVINDDVMQAKIVAKAHAQSKMLMQKEAKITVTQNTVINQKKSNGKSSQDSSIVTNVEMTSSGSVSQNYAVVSDVVSNTNESPVYCVLMAYNN